MSGVNSKRRAVAIRAETGGQTRGRAVRGLAKSCFLQVRVGSSPVGTKGIWRFFEGDLSESELERRSRILQVKHESLARDFAGRDSRRARDAPASDGLKTFAGTQLAQTAAMNILGRMGGMAVAGALLMWSDGCASSALPTVVDRDAQGECRLAADLRDERCGQIAFLPHGSYPSRPFRVVRMIEDWWDVAPGDRHLSLQLQACRLGADAVVETQDVLIPNYDGMSDAAARAATVGYAIVFTDARPYD